MALTRNQKIGIGAGIVVLAGGIWAVIYFRNKNKSRESGSAPSKPDYTVATAEDLEAIKNAPVQTASVGFRPKATVR